VENTGALDLGNRFFIFNTEDLKKKRKVKTSHHNYDLVQFKSRMKD